MNETECLLAYRSVGLKALLTFSRIKLIYLSRHLEVQHVTAEKQSPSALDYFAAIFCCAVRWNVGWPKPRPKQSSERSFDNSGWQLQQDVFNEVAQNQ